MSRMRRVSSGTAYPSPRFPNEPKKERSLRTCADVVPPRRASSPEEMVARPSVLACSRNRRYTDSRRTVLSEIFRIVNYFTIGDSGARESPAAGQRAGPHMLAGAHDLHDCNHEVQGLSPESVILRATLATLTNQTRLPEHLQVKGDGGLGCVQNLLQLVDASLALRKELEDRQARGVRSGMEPLRHARHLDGQRMRQMRQPRPAAWQMFGDSEQGSAVHGHQHTTTYQQLWICRVRPLSRRSPQQPDERLGRQPLGPYRWIEAHLFEIRGRNARYCVF